MERRQPQGRGTESCIGDPPAHGQFFWLALLVTVWSLELLAVQEFTAVPSDGISVALAVKFAARRMVLNISACVFLACILNRFWLYVTFGVSFLISNVLVVYAAYFRAPLSWPTIREQWQEGLAMTGHGASLVQWPVVCLLLMAVVLKIACREGLRRHLLPGVRLLRMGGIAAGLWLVLAIGLAGLYKPIGSIKFSSPEYTYGYTVAWCAEGLFFNEARLLQMALDAAQKRSDRLSPREPPLEFSEHVSIVQVESLDWDVIDAQVGREWVMPFLHDLRSRSMCYAIKPIHRTGTSDADFTLLTGMRANGKIAPYKLAKFPYRDTLPDVARQQGYTCVALHGYKGGFFDRRAAYGKMGFSEVFFAQELRELGCEMSEDSIADDQVLRLSSQWLQQAREPTLHFIITFTSHGPFNRIPAEKCELFPRPADETEAYLNSMRYVDRALEAYLEALPEGTLLVVYGDHESGVEGYHQAPRDDNEERVPWLIHRKGQNLARRQATRGTPLAQSGELGMLDLATYLHGSFKTSRGDSAPTLLATQPQGPATPAVEGDSRPPAVALRASDGILRR